MVCRRSKRKKHDSFDMETGTNDALFDLTFIFIDNEQITSVLRFLVPLKLAEIAFLLLSSKK